MNDPQDDIPLTANSVTIPQGEPLRLLNELLEERDRLEKQETESREAK